jgi:segregation and condensation protein B
MTIEQITLDIEALVFASDRALTLTEIHQVIADMYAEQEETIAVEQVSASLDTIQAKYDTEFHSFTLKEIGGGFQFLTKPQFHRSIAKLNGDKFMKRLSTAAMETLAIIAYKQPITKGDVEYIRGVSCDYSIQKLLEKELIVISGRNEEAVGKPLLYSTSKNFMDYLGLNSIEDLPKLSEIVPNDIVVPTNAELAFPEPAENTQLVVDESGALIETEKSADNSEAENPQGETTVTAEAELDQATAVEDSTETGTEEATANDELASGDGTEADDDDSEGEKEA